MDSKEASCTSTPKSANVSAFTGNNSNKQSRRRKRIASNWTPTKNGQLIDVLASYRNRLINFDDICKALTFSDPVSKESVKTQIFKLISMKNEFSSGKYAELLTDVQNQHDSLLTPATRKKRRIEDKSNAAVTSHYVTSSSLLSRSNKVDYNSDCHDYIYDYDYDAIDNDFTYDNDELEFSTPNYTPQCDNDNETDINKDTNKYLRLVHGSDGRSLSFQLPKCASSPFLYLENDVIYENDFVLSDIMTLPTQKAVMHAAGMQSLDYYYICDIKREKEKFRLCYSPVADKIFRISGSSNRYFKKYCRNQQSWNITKLMKIYFVVNETTTATFVSDVGRNKALTGVFTDVIFKNGIRAKKGSTGENKSYSVKKKNNPRSMGVVDYSHRTGFTDLDFDVDVKSQKKKGLTTKTKQKTKKITDKENIFNKIRENQTTINSNNYRLCKMNVKHLLLHYRNNNLGPLKVPLSTLVSDSSILSALSEVKIPQRERIISKLFEDTNWKFEPLRKLPSTISQMKLDIDYFSLDMILVPIAETFNYNNEAPYESQKIEVIRRHVEQYVMQNNQAESSFTIMKSEIKMTPLIKGHSFAKVKKAYFTLPYSQNVVFNIKVHFCSADESLNKLDIIWHAICNVYKFLSKDSAGEGKATAFECSLKENEMFRHFGGPALSLMVVLLLTTRYEIEIILENYNGKVIADCKLGLNEVSVKEAYERNIPLLNTLSGFCITRFFTSIDSICSLISSAVRVKHLYAGFGCLLKTESEGRHLFTCIKPIECPFEFNIENLMYDEETLGSSKILNLPHQKHDQVKSYKYFPILGGCVDRNLQPHHIYPEPSSMYIDQSDTFSLENVVRVQAYSSTVRAFALQSINKREVIRYAINPVNGIADFDKMSRNFREWIEQLERNVASIKQDGSEGRIEITIDMSDAINDDNIHQAMIDKLDQVRAVVLSNYSSYDISSRLDILIHLANAHHFKMHNYWLALDRAPALHVDLYGDFWDIWHDISKFTGSFWNGMFTSNKPFLPELQEYCSRAIFVPSGTLCNEQRNKLIGEVYDIFLRNIGLDPQKIVGIPEYMTVCPFKKKKYGFDYANVCKSNGTKVACIHCRCLFLQEIMERNKLSHPCVKEIDNNSFVKLSSEVFWESHKVMTENLDETQREIYDASLECPYLAILGCPGTGKTFLTRLIIERLVLVNGSSQVMPFSHNNDKADKIGGVTFHSFLGFDISTKVSDLINVSGWVVGHAGNLLRFHKDKYTRLQSVTYLVGDECSQISDELFQAGSQLLQYIRNDFTRPFGGVRIILAGDFSQISPIGGKLLFQNDEFLKHFFVRHLETYHRTACKTTIKSLDYLRIGDMKALRAINSSFGKNNSMGHSLFILDLILEKLLIDCTTRSYFFSNNCHMYDIIRDVWRGNLIIRDKSGYKINMLAKLILIERLENISADKTIIYYSNSEFFESFPITICSENAEVDFINENVITRGMPFNSTVHHIFVKNRSGIDVVRSFYVGGNVLIKTGEETFDVGELTRVTDDYNTLTILLTDKKEINVTGKDISTVFPSNYFMSQNIKNQINSDENICKFTRGEQVIYLRKGQRMLSRSTMWTNPFINKSTKFTFLGKDDSSGSPVIKVFDQSDSCKFRINITDLFPSDKKIPKVCAGYASTIDMFQGHEELNYIANTLRLQKPDSSRNLYHLNRLLVILSRSSSGYNVSLPIPLSNAMCVPDPLILSFNKVSRSQYNADDEQPKQLRVDGTEVTKTNDFLLSTTLSSNIFSGPVLVVPSEAIKKTLED